MAVAVTCVAAAAALAAWLAWPRSSAAKTLDPIPFGLTVQGQGTVLTFATTTAPPNVIPDLSALRTPRRASDEPPVIARILFSHMTLQATTDMLQATAGRLARSGPGKVALGRSRQLLAGLGRRSSELYAAPTAHGWACLVLAPEGVNHCVPAFSDDLAWLSLEQTQTRTLAVGLVPDRVSKVELAVDGTTRAARLARNGFFAELPGTPAADVSALLVTTRDGHRFRLPLDRQVFGR
jgi:hypothetical protein